MKCQHCRNNEATVHLVEMSEGRRRDLWLCGECADAEQWRRLDAVTDPHASNDTPQIPDSLPADNATFDSMLKFLGQPTSKSGKTSHLANCSHCGHTWGDFQETGQLGCARCYSAFRKMLLPMLAAFHRHATHLGKTPLGRAGGDSRLIEISRLRVALEEAIASENFEEAARLRDQLHALQQREQGNAHE